MLTQWEKEEEERSQNESTRNWDFWRKKVISPAGNRTPVSRVTGEDTHHYTTEDACGEKFIVRHFVKMSKKGKKVVPVRGIEPRPRR